MSTTHIAYIHLKQHTHTEKNNVVCSSDRDVNIDEIFEDDKVKVGEGKDNVQPYHARVYSHFFEIKAPKHNNLQWFQGKSSFGLLCLPLV